MSSLSKSEAWQFHAHGLDPGFQDVICMSYDFYGWLMLMTCIRNHMPMDIHIININHQLHIININHTFIDTYHQHLWMIYPFPFIHLTFFPAFPAAPAHRAPPTHDLTTEMEGVAEARLLALLGGQGLHRLQVEVVVQVQEVQVLAWKRKKHRLYEWADVPTVFLYNQQRTYFCALDQIPRVKALSLSYHRYYPSLKNIYIYISVYYKTIQNWEDWGLISCE